jgi:DNA-directed RNA polymerase specialized sigma24 family protein
MRVDNCDVCGSQFIDRSPAQKRRFCSARCRRDHFEMDESKRKMCEECGGPTGATPKPSAQKLCRACFLRRRDDARAKILAGYLAGKTTYEIADETGIPRLTVSREASRMRSRGIEVPKGPLGAHSHRTSRAA